jgi:OmpR-family two-component system manganese-sensing response regulator
MAKILVVEDNSEVLDNLREWLSMEKHNVDCCADGVQAIAYLDTYEYDIIVLDWALPKMSGLEICKQYRSQGGAAPIIMLTGRRSLDDKESGLDAGADDYLTKPFEMRELSARIRALLRRSPGAPTDVLQIGSLTLDKQAKRVTRAGLDLKLMPKDFAILELLMSYPRKVFSAESVVERIWGSNSEVSADVIRKHMNRIRTEIDKEGDQSLIRTVHGVGYAFEPES